MPYILFLEDYKRWKPLFAQHDAMHKESDCEGAHLFHSVEKPNEMHILFEWNDLNKAKQFIQSDDLRAAMQKAGVVGKPEIYFLDSIEKIAM